MASMLRPAATAAAMAARVKPRVAFLRLKQVPIVEQLRLEEALFRADKQRNWFICNEDSQPTTIVMGIAGKPELLLDQERVKRDAIPVLKRFSGGGTVVVDHNTLFTTFICNADAFPHVPPYPRELMAWSSEFFSPFFDRLCKNASSRFALREDDYVFNDRKCGGNAQSISKGRWLHHTSFLWDFDPANMEYLAHPARQPEYRKQRAHTDFLCTLREVLQVKTKSDVLDELERELHQHFDVEVLDHAAATEFLQLEHRRSTRFVEI